MLIIFQNVMYCFLITLPTISHATDNHVLFTLSTFIISINFEKGKYTSE